MQVCRTEIADADASDAGAAGSGVHSEPADAASRARGPFLAGAALALFAISIWSGWFVLTRASASTAIGAYDLVALRFGVAAIILLPISIRMQGGFGKAGGVSALALFVGSGAIYSLCVTVGVTFAPAAEGAALTPGIMPMATALLSLLFLKERLSKNQLAGLCFILAGVFIIVGAGLVNGAHGEWIGHTLFLTAAFLFAGYTIALRRSGLTPLQAIAVVSVWSCACYLPVYIIALHPHLLEVSPDSLLFPAFYQGVLTNVVSLVAYARAVSILGASRASSFAALIPAVTALASVPILGEFPSPETWAGIAAVSIGVYLASGAPLRRRSRRLKKSRALSQRVTG